MIELRTGLPGNGKTLSIVQELAALQAKWDKGDQSARPVFVHNIKDLALPHAVLPLQTLKLKFGELKTPDWDNVPDGALVIIDEAQDLFPPRSTQSIAPPHVAWLNTHRHRGVDIIVSTQHPKLIDGGLRALVGKHKHYRRLFGSSRSVVYEWDGCSDSLSGMKNATTTYWSFPKDAFKWYKSAEVHTKQSFKLPLWLGIPILGLMAALYFFPKAYSVVTNGPKVKNEEPARVQASNSAPGTARPANAAGGAIAPATTAQPGAVTESPQVVADSFVGCMASASKVICLTADGRVLNEPEGGREAAQTVGKLIPVNMHYQSEKTALQPEKLASPAPSNPGAKMPAKST